MSRRILITGGISPGLLMGLEMEGLECVQAGNEFTLHRQEAPCQNILWPSHERNHHPAYGPAKKGKGGKVKRW